MRHQYHHCTDIVPTILECCGLTMPEVVDGVKQSPLSGVSMRYSFDDAERADDARKRSTTRCSARAASGTRAGRRRPSTGPCSNKGQFDQDRWQLFHTDEDRAEAHDLADQHPEKVKELAALWLAEAKKNNALPLIDYGVEGIHSLEYHVAPPADGRYVYYPGTTEVPEASAARTLGASFKILAEVEFTTRLAGRHLSQGSRFGGYALFVKGGKLTFVYNFLGIPPEQRLTSPRAGARQAHRRRRVQEEVGEQEPRIARHDDAVRRRARRSRAASSGHRAGTMRSPAKGWHRLRQRRRGLAEYNSKFPFAGGQIIKVIYDVADDAYVDVERELAAALARD